MGAGAEAGAAEGGGIAEHVALEHLAALARAGDVADVYAAVGGVLGGGGRGRRACANGGKSRRWGGSGDRGCGGGGRGSGGGAEPLADAAEHGAGSDGVAILGDDFRQDAGGRRVDFERDLVGFELDQRLVGLDGVAGFFEPAADGRFGNGFAEGGNEDFSGHCDHIRR